MYSYFLFVHVCVFVCPPSLPSLLLRSTALHRRGFVKTSNVVRFTHENCEQYGSKITTKSFKDGVSSIPYSLIKRSAGTYSGVHTIPILNVPLDDLFTAETSLDINDRVSSAKNIKMGV